MKLTRRHAIAIGASSLIATQFAAIPARAELVDDAIAAFTGGVEIIDGGIELIAPEIAENGNTVPVEVTAAGATEIIIFATGNPSPDVATFKFGRLAGSHSASTRIRLASTQDVVALAKMEDGTIRRAVSQVKVTIGGCGG